MKWSDIIGYVNNGNPKPDKVVVKSDEEWKSLLSPDAFFVLRQKGTERAFSSDMCHLFESGMYACGACGQLLFDATQKFDSGTGWPSFTNPVSDNAIAYHADRSYGMVRVETVCNCCGSHLGHVFPDGPAPTGLRYCMNALALKKVK